MTGVTKLSTLDMTKRACLSTLEEHGDVVKDDAKQC